MSLPVASRLDVDFRKASPDELHAARTARPLRHVPTHQLRRLQSYQILLNNRPNSDSTSPTSLQAELEHRRRQLWVNAADLIDDSELEDYL
eukprot:CAMPEP_0202901372 /NCGR_PEP_ID=MMETSP1392-20130828/14216_1 /ASSEMBLY_ACC=CAM_ASM_000868 /TAXON_ID=225041 /ORGANISM="Chlamydomonas chlamydogama, Strain SAG 11-48b" /LENGTH=90 /DNA_ID=CAMNT_0049587923 /DNA_START=96 /DNA_END=368 /DNA_ORIENTATION=+